MVSPGSAMLSMVSLGFSTTLFSLRETKQATLEILLFLKLTPEISIHCFLDTQKNLCQDFSKTACYDKNNCKEAKKYLFKRYIFFCTYVDH